MCETTPQLAHSGATDATTGGAVAVPPASPAADAAAPSEMLVPPAVVVADEDAFGVLRCVVGLRDDGFTGATMGGAAAGATAGATATGGDSATGAGALVTAFMAAELLLPVAGEAGGAETDGAVGAGARPHAAARSATAASTAGPRADE